LAGGRFRIAIDVVAGVDRPERPVHHERCRAEQSGHRVGLQPGAGNLDDVSAVLNQVSQAAEAPDEDAAARSSARVGDALDGL
jgi:hypothetical protein